MRVLVTRPQEQAATFIQALREIGADPISLPMIAIRGLQDQTELDRVLTQLARYDWLILTSANAADVVLARLAALGIGALPKNLRVAAIGPKTAARLAAGGIHPDFIPGQYIAEAILPGLGDLRDRRVLLPLADIAPDTLPEAINASGGIVETVTAYRTIPTSLGPDGLALLRAGVDVITFTSGSTVRNFVSLLQNAGLDPLNLPESPKVACIGPKTAKIAQDLGFTVDIVADPHTTDGLVQAIQILNTPNTIQQMDLP
jgi:uroporphyrinogen-III synthase